MNETVETGGITDLLQPGLTKVTVTFEFDGLRGPVTLSAYGTERDMRLLATRMDFWRKTEIASAALLFEIERMAKSGDSVSPILYEEDPIMAAIRQWEARNEGATAQTEERTDG